MENEKIFLEYYESARALPFELLKHKSDAMREIMAIKVPFMRTLCLYAHIAKSKGRRSVTMTQLSQLYALKKRKMAIVLDDIRFLSLSESTNPKKEDRLWIADSKAIKAEIAKLKEVAQ